RVAFDGGFVKRRQFLGLTAASALLGGFPRWSFRRAAAAPRRGVGPRYLVLVCPAGGIDAVLTTDPKERRDVDADVDVPFASAEIVSRGGVVFGPHFAPLLDEVPRMTVLNGVRTNSANHQSGLLHFQSMRQPVPRAAASLPEIFGQYRDTQPLA